MKRSRFTITLSRFFGCFIAILMKQKPHMQLHQYSVFENFSSKLRFWHMAEIWPIDGGMKKEVCFCQMKMLFVLSLQTIIAQHAVNISVVLWNSSMYNIICWFAGLFVPANLRRSVRCSKYYFSFIISCKILCKNSFKLFFFYFLIIKIKSFKCPKSIRNYEKNNAWNIRCLVAETNKPVNQRIIIEIDQFMLIIKFSKEFQIETGLKY